MMIEKENILEFISNFLNHTNEDAARELFLSGYCYHFAHILKATYGCGEVCWAAPYGHFIWLYDKIAYDIEGEYFKESQEEKVTFVPESFMGDLIYDFKRIPNLFHNTSKEEIEEVIKITNKRKEAY